MMALYIFDMGGVMASNVHCVPAMAAALGLDQAGFFAAAGASAQGEGSGYNGGDVLAIQEGALDADAFWERFEARCRRLFPDRELRVPRGAAGHPVDLWAETFTPSLDPAMEALVHRLRSDGCRVVCGTNTMEAHYRIHTERGDYRVFDAVYASHLMGVAKPAPAFWERILSTEGRTAGESVFVDDAAENVRAARELGIQSFLFSGAPALEAALGEVWAAGHDGGARGPGSPAPFV